MPYIWGGDRKMRKVMVVMLTLGPAMPAGADIFGRFRKVTEKGGGTTLDSVIKIGAECIGGRCCDGIYSS
jgi:hypothetical protein